MFKLISQVGPIRLPLKIGNKEHFFILNYFAFDDGRWVSAQYENTPVNDYVPLRIESADQPASVVAFDENILLQ